MRFLAFDLGAESGRAIVGTLRDGRLTLDEVYRFPNEPVRVLDNLYWDALRLFHEIKRGLRLAVARYGRDIQSIGIDTWGVDFALLGEKDILLSNPYHYRDSRTQGVMEEAFKRVPQDKIFYRTGIQFMPINSLYQLLAYRLQQPSLLAQAKAFLMMPDLFNFFLTGQKASEFTIATTTQMYDPRKREWARELLTSLEIPSSILPEIHPPGTILGTLLPQVAKETGAREVPVIAPASHDTASAVAAVPAQTPDYLYISSGTWSLVGVEAPEPVITQDTLRLNFTNEGGVGGSFRLLKNIVGLWLVQECRRAFERQGEILDYTTLTQMAQEARPLVSLVDPDHPSFLNPEDMPAAIQKFCQETGQPVPQSKGEIIRCALESLALKYRWVLDRLEKVLGKRLQVIHIVGGGSKNELLCQFAANATGRPVLAGPVEATAMGNLLVQAMALKQLASLAELRQVVNDSCELKGYEPQDRPSWEEAYWKFEELLK